MTTSVTSAPTAYRLAVTTTISSGNKPFTVTTSVMSTPAAYRPAASHPPASGKPSLGSDPSTYKGHPGQEPPMVSTSPANETDDAALQAELFSQCDQGASLLADISGPRYQTSLSSLLLAICSIVTTSRFARELEEWHKMPHHSVIAFFYTFKSKRTETYDLIMKATTLAGSACRKNVAETITFLCHSFNLKSVHDIFIWSLIIYCWGEESSPQSALILLTVKTYLSTAHDKVAEFVSNCTSSGTTVLSGSPITGSVSDTPGYLRLSWKTNIHGCTRAWMDLLQCCVGALIASKPEHSAKQILHTVTIQAGDADHPLLQDEDESVQLYIARHVAAFTDAHCAMDGLGPSHPSRLPDTFLRAEYLLNGCLPSLRLLLQEIFIMDLKVTEDDLTFEVMCSALALAEERSRTTFSALPTIDSTTPATCDGADSDHSAAPTPDHGADSDHPSNPSDLGDSVSSESEDSASDEIEDPASDSDEIEDPSSDSEVLSTDDHDLDDLASNALNYDDNLHTAADPLLVSFLTT